MYTISTFSAHEFIEDDPLIHEAHKAISDMGDDRHIVVILKSGETFQRARKAFVIAAQRYGKYTPQFRTIRYRQVRVTGKNGTHMKTVPHTFQVSFEYIPSSVKVRR